MARRRTHPNSIARFRGIKGWSLKELSRVSRIDEWTVRHLETGKLDMHAGHMSRLSTLFDVTVDELCKPCVSRRNPQQSRSRSLDNLDKGRGHARYAGKLKVPDNRADLIRELYEILNKHKLLVADAADGSGVSPVAVSDWRYRRSPTLQSFEAVLNNIGYSLQIVRDDDA
jgi:transcriptional regulator with XRE-family HTH domain